MPWDSAAHQVGKAARGIEGHAVDATQREVLRAPFQWLDPEAIGGIFAHDHQHAAEGRHDEVNVSGSAGLFSDVADRRLAQRTEFELRAVGRGPSHGAHATGPVAGVAELEIYAARIVLYLDEARARALHGMSEVVRELTVAIAPSLNARGGVEPFGKPCAA